MEIDLVLQLKQDISELLTDLDNPSECPVALRRTKDRLKHIHETVEEIYRGEELQMEYLVVGATEQHNNPESEEAARSIKQLFPAATVYYRPLLENPWRELDTNAE